MRFYMNIISKFSTTAPALISASIVGKGGQTGVFRVIEDLTHRKPSSFISFIKPEAYTYYHGTSKEALGKQLTDGKFENLGKGIYIGTKETALGYAARRILKGETGVILAVSSPQKPKMNSISLEGWGNDGLGAYSFFDPTKADVAIEKAYNVTLEHMNPTLAELLAAQVKKEKELNA